MTSGTVRTAFILGAGLGTRLRPLTEACPKPLLPVGGRPLITYAMDHCLTAGIRRFIVNTHYCAAAYDQAFPERSWRGWPILFCHEPVLLDTAGGLKNIEDRLDPGEPLLVYNGDIVSDLPLEALLDAHTAGGTEVTLALRSHGPLRNVRLNAAGAIVDLRDVLGRPGVRRCQFTGIWLVEKRFFRRLAPEKIESVVPVFLEMLREAPGSVGSVVIDAGRWEDIGDPGAYSRIRDGLPPDVKTAGKRKTPGTTGQERAAWESAPEVLVGDNPGGTGQGEAARYVRAVLGLPGAVAVALKPVGRGGSDRDYFRVTAGERAPLILMRYQRLREENCFYAAIAGFLQAVGVTVPAIFGHDPERGFLLMEDLGDADLYALREAPWGERRELYEKTLRLAAKLHAFPLADFPAGSVRLMPGFSPELYKWERDYFREQCVGKACGVTLSVPEAEALEEELEGLGGRLIETPQALVHRDLQSQNVMVRAGEPVLIDFQGMRFGSPFYDLASLLYDPYVSFPEEGRERLLRFYHAASASPCDWEAFRGFFLLASAQRLMQALGAYGFLGIEKGKTHFLAHIPGALERLISVTEGAGSLPHLNALSRRCRSSLARKG